MYLRTKNRTFVPLAHFVTWRFTPKRRAHYNNDVTLILCALGADVHFLPAEVRLIYDFMTSRKVNTSSTSTSPTAAAIIHVVRR